MSILTVKLISHELCRTEQTVLTSYTSSVAIQRETSSRVCGSLGCSSEPTASSTNFVAATSKRSPRGTHTIPAPISDLSTAMTRPTTCLHTRNAASVPRAVCGVILHFSGRHAAAGSWISPLSLCSRSGGTAIVNG